ncbi:hypothetical protein VTL71DRAFT_14114 [Oculimacula yallundae]|uniref:Uncharacterized protein n=1 Tax=Oculimacula yallundae TaxID=86028 RepID=A0ABR4CHK5_9HELO
MAITRKRKSCTGIAASDSECKRPRFSSPVEEAVTDIPQTPLPNKKRIIIRLITPSAPAPLRIRFRVPRTKLKLKLKLNLRERTPYPSPPLESCTDGERHARDDDVFGCGKKTDGKGGTDES